MKDAENRRRKRIVRWIVVTLFLFMGYYFYSSYVNSLKNEVIVVCTIGVIVCMGLRCMSFVAQNKKEDSVEMEDDI